jgi:hypothetical protein
VRSGFRDFVPLRGDRFLIADIPISMHVHAGRCRAERVHVFTFCPGGISLFRSYMMPFSHRNPGEHP